ncbi:MAG: carbamoyltransferase HypF [Desulfomonilaceae bacterium]
MPPTTICNSEKSAADGKVRKHIALTGILQGIGCRPTIYRLATRLDLVGWVVNTSAGVRIEVEGSPGQCDRFVRELPSEIPFPGRIDTTRVEDTPALGEEHFCIRASQGGERSITPIPPDVAICPACVEELFDSKNPRYLYPFITCTLCGPRFTVVRAFPYDRERTSMADFTMCPRCEREYHSPEDRRFHSQTNSCPECGPRLTLTDSDGSPIDGDPIVVAASLLKEGKTVAIKGIGGFHLACDALNEDAVNRLRQRKGRIEKPFAVMMPDLETVQSYCSLGKDEATLLASSISPIVLLQTGQLRAAPNVAPFVGTLGVMLPYSPVHHLLFKHPGIPIDARPKVMVMTSGNRSEEPIACGNEEALERLKDLADAFLLHNRDIVLRTDDSIFRFIAGRATAFRRSRGLVPGEFILDPKALETSPEEKVVDEASGRLFDSPTEPVILGAGGDLKNSLAIIKKGRAVPGPHVGDLASPVAQQYFKQSAKVLTDYLDASPDIVAVDPHPEYFSNSLGREIGVPVEEVFHHHAHAVSLLLEHGLAGPIICAVFDGTGYGTDAGIWGGEFLIADLKTFSRSGHLSLFHLPGGEAAIREPVRILAALLAEQNEIPTKFNPLLGEYGNRVRMWIEAVNKGLNSPRTTSAGRLFDAAAAAVGFRRPVTFEGQAAMWLEGIADEEEIGEYPISFSDGETLVADSRALILEVAKDILSGTRPPVVAARFQNSMARLVANGIGILVEKNRISTVGVSGGCFQNKLFTERAVSLLMGRGLEVLLHSAVPPNDGGIALGQALCARARLCRSRRTGGNSFA